jgi:hypothetical protein
MDTAVLAPVEERENSKPEVSAPSSQWAQLEFQATLQLLVERARFLTGAGSAGIALQEEDRLVYAAVSGDDAPQPGSLVDLTKTEISQCIKDLKPLRAKIAGPLPFTLLVPILRDTKFAGCFELLGLFEFEDRDLEQVSRLAQLASTAIEYRDGALKAARLEFEDVPHPQPAPALWHAPDIAQQPAAEPETATSSPAVDVHNCASCGFPVSGRRALCLECEQKADVTHPVPEVLTTPVHESWISSHGYTIASLFLSALVIAVIFWLRH